MLVLAFCSLSESRRGLSAPPTVFIQLGSADQGQAGMAFPDSDRFGGGSDSGGFVWIPSSPQRESLAYFAVCMGIMTLLKWITDSDRFG